MPRRPFRRSQLGNYQPLTFSSFARSIAQIASTSTVNRQRQEPKVKSKELTSNNMKSKNDQIEASDDEDFDGVIQADFVFFDPKPDDFHGVKALLQIYLDDKHWDLSGFVDLILGQTTVGTVIKIENDEENNIWSIVTALNLYRYREHKCIVELKEYLLTVCHEKDFSSNLRSLLNEEAHSVGLLVSKHNTCLPDKLLPPLYDALFDEVSWATEDEPTAELQKSFCFKFYIVICQIGMLKSTSQKKRQKNEEEIIYRKPEDEIFHKLSLWSITYPLNTEQLLTFENKNYRLMGLVMAVEAKKIPLFRRQLHSLIDES
ncbi:protein BCCIP homolog isoform X2 [Humulus lupulus]|uniref:protein BCCIP homolog isoform X2 n=1 Tax=Humulus lupulus TaxID=3486 RepID=UPI002B40498A|nr:protein BCCIP homolog isoform X2 [Humulus lupulus]